MDIYTVLLLVGMAVMSLAKYRENYVCTNLRSACVTWALQGWCDVPTYWTRYHCCHSCHNEATGCPNGQTRNHEGECQDINFCGTYPQHKRCPGEEICKNKKGGFICGNCASGHTWDKGSQKCVANQSPSEYSSMSHRQKRRRRTKTTMKTTSTTTATTLPPPERIDGICPDTDRSLETLPDGRTILMDRKSADGPWTVIQRRTDDSESFDRNWSAYEFGFGSKSSSFWLGLREIHNLCNKNKQCQLLINLKFSGVPYKVARVADGCYHASYSEFWLSGPADDYVLNVSGYRGTAGDCLTWPQNYLMNVTGKAFTTKDTDARNGGKCGQSYHAGWWFINNYQMFCTWSCLNARFGEKTRFVWLQLTGQHGPLEFTEMKVRNKM